MPGSGQFALLPVWAGALLRFAGAEHNFFAVFRFAAEGGVALLFIVLPPIAHIFRRQQGKGFKRSKKAMSDVIIEEQQPQRKKASDINTLNIVLVEPQIPQNTGNIARTCAVTGARLHLVGPMGFVIDDAKLKRAGLDYWHLLDVTHYSSLDDFFTRNSGEFFYFSTKARRVYSDIAYPDGAYLIFGKETAGLPEDLLFRNPESCVRFPMADGARSLNLSNSVAIGVYEVLRQWGFPRLKCGGSLTKFDWDSKD